MSEPSSLSSCGGIRVGNVRLWQADAADAKASVNFLKPRDRRRLSALGRAAFTVLEPFMTGSDALDPARDAVLFVSRLGDLPLTATLLADMRDPDGLSPTAFSTSVHNAIGGLFTILTGFQGHVSAMGAGEAGISAALVEAAALLTEFERVVVCVYDAESPEVFRAEHPENRTFAFAFEVTKAQNDAEALRFAVDQGTPPNTHDLMRPLAALNFLEGRTDRFVEDAEGVRTVWVRGRQIPDTAPEAAR